MGRIVKNATSSDNEMVFSTEAAAADSLVASSHEEAPPPKGPFILPEKLASEVLYKELF